MRNILELDKAVVESIDNIKYSTDKDFEYWKKNPYPTLSSKLLQTEFGMVRLG